MKKTVVQNKEVEMIDTTNPIEIMRHRDTDADGVCDYVDGNGYSKVQDKYLEITKDEYNRLEKSGFDLTNNCRRGTNPNTFILRYSEKQKDEIDTILKSSLRRCISQ